MMRDVADKIMFLDLILTLDINLVFTYFVLRTLDGITRRLMSCYSMFYRCTTNTRCFVFFSFPFYLSFTSPSFVGFVQISNRYCQDLHRCPCFPLILTDSIHKNHSLERKSFDSLFWFWHFIASMSIVFIIKLASICRPWQYFLLLYFMFSSHGQPSDSKSICMPGIRVELFVFFSG